MGQEVWVGSRCPNGPIKGQQALGNPTGCSVGQMWVGSTYTKVPIEGQKVLGTPKHCSMGQEEVAQHTAF